MVSAVCATTESAPSRILRRGCSTVALVAAALLAVASALNAYFATTAVQVTSRIALVAIASALLLACFWAMRDAARSRLPVLLFAIVYFVVLALAARGHAGTGATPTPTSVTRYIDGDMPMALLVAVTVIGTQISARFAQRATCSCG